MNNLLTIEKTDRAISGVKSSICIDRTTQDAAQWVCVILAELRQQTGLNYDSTMQELYEATVNLRDKLALCTN
jgi:hypothetical protein